MRLAWFTPWPPQRSGIAGRSAELVPFLASRGHGIDVFVDEQAVPVARSMDAAAPAAGRVRVQSAHDFIWRQQLAQFDLIVYQLGNSRLHQFIWPYLFRWPGLAVLHDARLHHARGRALLAAKRADAYREEFAWSHPDASPDAAELGVRGFDGAYYYAWPFVRGAITASKITMVHSPGGARELAAAMPDAHIEYVPLGEGRETVIDDATRARIRASLGWTADTVAFGLFGALTVEKRVPQAIRAFATAHGRVPSARLLLAGTPDSHLDLVAIIQALGLESCVTIVTSPDDDRFDDLIAAVDVSLNLRWPTAVEMSGPWLRAMAAGRATVIVDLVQHADVPTLDPRSWRPNGLSGQAPVAIAVDILDEDHSLRQALHRLAEDAALRRELGQSARLYWEKAHALAHMASGYERLMAQAAALPDPHPALPAGLRPDALASTRAILRSAGEVTCVFV